MSGSSSIPIACSGYNQNQFFFISRNSDRNDYHLNTVSIANQTLFRSQPLFGINGYPQSNNTGSSFMGLCSYASKSSSMYLSFEGSGMINSTTNSNSSTSYNTTISSIYQLQISSNGTYQLAKTAIELYNTTLFSFVYTSDNNNTNNLAYIATNTIYNNGTQQQRTSLNLKSLDLPATYYTSKNISGTGLLAVGGSNAQNLYFIQSNTIEEYRLDTMDYSESSIQANVNLTSINPGTTGQALSVINNQNNLTIEYISVYYQDTAEIDIFAHDSSRSKYTALPIVNGYISFFNSSINSSSPGNLTTSANSNSTIILSTSGTATATVTSTSSISNSRSAITNIDGSRDSAIASNSGDAKPSPTVNDKLKSSSSTAPSSTPTAKDPSSSLKKRGLTNSGSPVSSSEGAYTYRKASITSDNNDSLLPDAAVLTAANSADQEPPYNIISLSGNDIKGYSVSSMSGTGGNFDVGTIASAPAYGLSGGAIAGIAIGAVSFIVIVVGLLFYTKKRKCKKTTKLRSFNSSGIPPLSIQPDEFMSTFMVMNRGMTNTRENHGNTSSILQESKYIPEEYHDGSRPDIRPLSYSADTVDYAQLSGDELLKLEPDVEGPLFLFSGLYSSSADEKVSYLKDGYAIRTFDSDDGNKHTIHYFSSANLDIFIRSVYSALQLSRNTAVANNKYIVKSERAIVLDRPTPTFSYQYIWITSPMIPEHSLYHLLFERKKWTFVDHHNSDYKIWSIYAILKSIEAVQSHKFVHLAVDLKSFYYDHEMKATDWRLGNFTYAQPYTLLTRNNILLPANHSSFTAPEIITLKDTYNLDLEAVDIWSVGCVIYTIATGGLLLFENDIQIKNLVTFNNDMKQHLKMAFRDNIENEIFKNLLEKMLQVDPKERTTITEVLDYWDSIYNMEE